MPFDAPEPASLRVISLNLVSKGNLIGFVTVQFANGMTIHDCPIFNGQHGVFVTLPAKPVLDRDGVHRAYNGAKQYTPVLSWATREASDAFSGAVLAAVRANHPGVLSDV